MKKIKVLFGVYPWAFDCPGGGERQLLAYKEYLTRLGVQVDFYNQWEPNIDRYNIFHFFSVMPGSIQLCNYMKEKGLKLFISPNLWVTEETKYNYPHNEIKNLLDIADKIIVNSKLEADSLSRVYEIEIERFAIVYNGVEEIYFSYDNNDLFVDKYNLRNTKYILNVANIEIRKNQLKFLEIIKNYPDYKLVVIGNIRDESYYRKCLEIAKEQLLFIGPLEYGSKLLNSAYLGCEFFVMPSMLETPSIAALEAAATGAKILITKVGSTSEYFKDYVEYVDPNDLNSISFAFNKIIMKNKTSNLKNYLKDSFSWEKVCIQLKNEYDISINRI